MFSHPIVLDHYGARKIRDEDIDAAVDAYFRDPSTSVHPIGNDILIDIAAAIEGSAYVRLALGNQGVPDAQKRQAIRAAILLARPYQ